MMSQLRLILVAAALTTIGSPALAMTLCGVDYHDRADLTAKLRDNGAKFFNGKSTQVASISSSNRLSLWWLTEIGSPNFPAIACATKDARPSGFKEPHAEVDCHGTIRKSCIAFRRQISRAKF
jgi:hypothetical protein